MIPQLFPSCLLRDLHQWQQLVVDRVPCVMLKKTFVAVLRNKPMAKKPSHPGAKNFYRERRVVFLLTCVLPLRTFIFQMSNYKGNSDTAATATATFRSFVWNLV